MGIHFSEERWKEVEETYQAWWDGTLERSIIKATVRNAYKGDREKPSAPILSQANCNQLFYSPEEIVDHLDYELSKCEFLGDSFPFVNMMCFGASALAGMCGAEMENRTGSVWYFPKEKKSIEELHIHYDPNSTWAMRIKDIYRAGQKRWGNMVLFSMPDLGGFQDVVATLLGSDELLCALIEEPEEVKRLQEEVYQAFFEAYEDFAKVLSTNGRGYADWCGLFSKEPSYILQDDFAYMISPSMFCEFGLPQIKDASEKLTHTIYHLDGVGNLNHLDAILETPSIQAVQWVYGAGQPGPLEWMEVYDKIKKAGKNIEIVGSLEEFEILQKKYEKGLYYHLIVDDENGNVLAHVDEKDCLNDYHVVESGKLEMVRWILKENGVKASDIPIKSKH